MEHTKEFNSIFDKSIVDYHKHNDINREPQNPYTEGSFQFILYNKNWIDDIQWHLEDIIRDPEINPVEALKIKRRIDRLNQQRTDMVEMIDTYFLEKFQDVEVKHGATLNTETPAWAIDRLSILALKIYHMQAEAQREGADPEHIARCKGKLEVLLSQREDLSSAIDRLLEEIQNGDKYMKTYRQMKMYNDPSLNPVLYGTKRG